MVSVFTSDKHEFPGFDHFYYVTDPFDRFAFRGSAQVDDVALNRGESLRNETIVVSHASGGVEPRDLIWTTAMIVVISNRVVELLCANRFTGWKSYPVTVSGTPKSIPGYVGLSVTGRCGPLLPARSARRLKEMPGGLKERRIGWNFDETSWDGSDIFTFDDGGAARLVHERVKQSFEDAKVTNVKFERLDQVEWKDIGQFLKDT
jgi:hypothetical protein